MAYRRGDGVFGLVGELADEAKWFADQRAPYPIEKHLRSAVSAPVDGRDVPQAWADSARGVGRAVLDDEVDSDEPRRRSSRPRRRDVSRAREDREHEERRQDRDPLSELRAEVRALSDAVDRLTRRRGG